MIPLFYQTVSYSVCPTVINSTLETGCWSCYHLIKPSSSMLIPLYIEHVKS